MIDTSDVDRASTVGALDRPALDAVLAQAGAAFAAALGFVGGRNDGVPQYRELAARARGFVAMYAIPKWDNDAITMATLFVDVDTRGVFQGGFWTRGEVPATLLIALGDSVVRERLWTSAAAAMPSTVAVLEAVRNDNGAFTVRLRRVRAPSPRLVGEVAYGSVEVRVDATGAPVPRER